MNEQEKIVAAPFTSCTAFCFKEGDERKIPQTNIDGWKRIIEEDFNIFMSLNGKTPDYMLCDIESYKFLVKNKVFNIFKRLLPVNRNITIYATDRFGESYIKFHDIYYNHTITG